MAGVLKKIIKISLIIITIPITLFTALLGVSLTTEYSPNKIETIYSGDGDTVMSDTITLLSWNIGYCGLGDDMDFFYDGGSSMRTSKERTQQNLECIVTFLESMSSVDFILLQEIDIDSHRSYGINQLEAIESALLNHTAYFAYNYKSLFVPIPITDPMGGVESGLALLSKYRPTTIERHQYPGSFSFPVRLFNLKRAALKASFKTKGAEELVIINTHNSAYDDGGMRNAELAYLDSILIKTPLGIVAGDWNSTPDGYVQSTQESQNQYFQPLSLDQSIFSCEYKTLYDASVYSNRYGYEPYRKGSTTETLLDFALVSKSIEPISVETIDLGFSNSDHNPILITVAIR